jgi:hypothetical protein
MSEKQETTTGLLPPDSSGLFLDSELQDHNFAQSSFTEDDVGTSVTECDLTNIDTSHVETMSGMFFFRESFDQDISAWCVKQITQKPSSFDEEAGFEGINAKNQIGGTPLKQTLSASSLAEPEKIRDSCVSVSTVQMKLGFVTYPQVSDGTKAARGRTRRLGRYACRWGIENSSKSINITEYGSTSVLLRLRLWLCGYSF